MLTNGPDVNIVALGIHAFKPRRVFLDFSTIPFTVHHLAGLLVTNTDLYRSVPKALICLWRATAVRSERVSDVLPLPAGRAVSDSRFWAVPARAKRRSQVLLSPP